MPFAALRWVRDWLGYADNVSTPLQMETRLKPVVGIEFYNRKATKLLLWIEMSCNEVILEPATEYRIESEETEYRLEFDGEVITLYLQYVFGPRIYRKNFSADIENAEVWELITDDSDVTYRLPNKL